METSDQFTRNSLESLNLTKGNKKIL